MKLRFRRPERSALAMAAVSLFASPVIAATINVNGGTCTLAEALANANGDNGAGNGCVAGSGADTLVLVAGSTHSPTNSLVVRAI
ncbi:MAG: hypothetical protein ACT4PZ_04890 [Panacagrimonas sp.]